MHKTIISTGAAFMLAAVSLPSSAQESKPRTFDKPAGSSSEAVNIGSGLTEATIYGTFPDEKIVLNNGKEQFATLTIYHSVPVKSRVTKYQRGLNPDTNIAFTDIKLTNGLRNEHYFASPVDSVLVMTYNDAVPLFCTIVLKSDYAKDIKSFDDQITMTGTLPGESGDGTDFTTILKVIPGAGNITTNPDASLTLNYMEGATLLISTVKSPEADLAKLRVFRASYKLKDGLERYCHISPDDPMADEYVTYSTVAAPDGSTATDGAMDIVSTDAEGRSDVVMRTLPDHIEFLPMSATRPADGEADDVSALGAFKISFRWEKGKVTGGNISYYPKDYMNKETDVELILNGEPHNVHFTAGQTIPLENFVDLVRPFIQ